MKKNRFIVLFTIALIAMAIISFAFFTGSKGEKQISINDIPQDIMPNQGVTGNKDVPLLKMITSKDLEEIYDSIDPITGQPTYIPPVMAKISEEDEFQEVERCTLSCTIYDEPETYDFTFKYLVKDGKKILVPGDDKFSSHKIPNSDDWVIDCWGLIYLVNLDEGRLEVYNSKEAGGYSFYTYNETIYRKVWAGKPAFNPSGTKMLYFTERTDYEGGKLWVMDTVTKTEKPIPYTKGYTNVLQWVSDDIVYINTPYKVLCLDISNYTSQVIYGDDRNSISKVAISYPYMFTCDLKGSRIHNLEDGSIRGYDDSKYNYCSAAVSSGYEHKILLTYSLQRKDIPFYHEAVVLDLETGKDCVISIVNEKDTIAMFLPFDDQKAKLDVKIGGNTYNRVSYFIEYSSLVFD